MHEPVIDAATWTAYQAARAARRTLRRSERSQYLLSGLVRCMHPLDDGTVCDSPMGGGQFGHNHQPKFRCIAAAASRRHDGGYVTMSLAEDVVRTWLTEQAADVETNADAAALQQARVMRRRVDAKALAREVVEPGTEGLSQVEASADQPARVAARLLEEWDEISVEQRRATLRELIARVEVVPARPRSTVTVVPAWAMGDKRA